MSAPSRELTGPFCRVPWQQFSRSPRHSLPAHLCRFWYGPLDTPMLEAFPGSRIRHFATFRRFRFPFTPCLPIPDLPGIRLLRLALNPFRGLPIPSPSLLRLVSRGCRNLRLLSIRYAFRPRVRSRLTQGGRTFPWNPWAFGVQDSHLHLATHTGILSSMLSICRLRHTSSCMQRSPTTYTSIYIRSFGTWLKPRYIFGAGPLD